MLQLGSKTKMNGLLALRGSWLKAILIMSMIGLLYIGLSKLADAYRNVFNVPEYVGNFINTSLYSVLISVAFIIISFFVLTPLILGMKEWYWNLTADTKTGIGDVFAWYGSLRLYFKSIALGINIGIRSFLWAVLTIGLPTAMLLYAWYLLSAIKIPADGVTLSEQDSLKLVQMFFIGAMGAVLLIGGLLLLLYICSRYTVACYLMVEDDKRGIREVVRDSVKYTREYRWEITKFLLSFVAWFFCCILIFPALFAVPYFNSALALLAKHIILVKRPRNQNGDTIQFNSAA